MNEKKKSDLSEDEIGFSQKKEVARDGKKFMGEINYRIYEDGVVVFMGSFTEKEYRGQGVFKKLLTHLLDKLPKGTTVYVPLSSMGKHMINMFERMGFKKTNEFLRYWGDLENSTNMKKIL